MAAPELPRYRVSKLTGYRIRPNFESYPGDKELTDWYVHDSWCSYAEVAHFTSEHKARQLARRLERRNAWDLAYGGTEIKPGSTLRHGTISCYVNLPCRCEACTAACREYQRKRRKARVA